MLSALLLVTGCRGASTDPVQADTGVGSSPRDGRDTGTDRDAAPSDSGSPLDAGADFDAGSPLDEFSIKAATAVCSSLFRCCAEVDQAAYFLPFRRDDDPDWALAAFRSRLPPEAVGFDEAQCRQVLGDIYEIMPFGDWVRAAQVGLVTFDPSAYQGCLNELANAACGAPILAALYDSSCLGFAAPIGERRRMFHRASEAGDECRPIADGVGARIYGTCDPTKHFCCFRPANAPTGPCWLPMDGAAGRCETAAALGEECRFDFQGRSAVFCQTGLDCDQDQTPPRCVASDSAASLNLGELCIRGSQLLGECRDGWCDLLDTQRCAAWLPEGTSCNLPQSCQSGLCEGGICVADHRCRP